MNSIILLLLVVFVSLVKANIYYDLSEEEYKEVKNSRNFSGKVVLVSGSSAGIGEGIVKLFSILGANVVVTGRKANEVSKVAQEVQLLSPNKLKPLEVVADVTKSDDLNRLLNETIGTFGKLDVLVNNAGISLISGIKDQNFTEVFDQIIKTNLRAYLELIHLSVPYLEKTNGSIIQISSIDALAPAAALRGGGLSYAVSKVAVDMASRVLALELGPKIRVNTINPGATQTQMASGIDPITREKIAQGAPLKRIGYPLDIAKGVVFLASSDAQFITGANLVIDGGLVYNAGGLME